MNLSYLMGGKHISDADLEGLGVTIAGTNEKGDRELQIPDEKRADYIGLVKEKLERGFWNEIIGETQILFLFKSDHGALHELELSPPTEKEIDALCAKFTGEVPDKTPNVYKFLSENDFYRHFMMKHYADMIART